MTSLPCASSSTTKPVRLRGEVRLRVSGEEEGHGDSQSGNGDQRVPRNIQDPQAEEGEQVQDDGRRGRQVNVGTMMKQQHNFNVHHLVVVLKQQQYFYDFPFPSIYTVVDFFKHRVKNLIM